MEDIKKDMTFGELLQKYPQAGPVLMQFGLHCVGCHIGTMETIEQGGRAHGFSEEKIDEMISALNNAVA